MPLEEVKRCLANDQFAKLAGIELLTVTPGAARARMPLRPHHCNALGTVHGGAIFTLADFTFAAACNSHGTVAVALNVSITFMKAATTGTLWAEAHEVAKNFKVGSYAVTVRDDQDDLIASFQGLAYRKKDPLPV